MNYKQENKVEVKVIFKSAPAPNELKWTSNSAALPKTRPPDEQRPLPQSWCNVPKDAKWIFEDAAWGANTFRLNAHLSSSDGRGESVSTQSRCCCTSADEEATGGGNQVQADRLVPPLRSLSHICPLWNVIIRTRRANIHDWLEYGGLWCYTLRPPNTTTSPLANSNSPSESQGSLSYSDDPLGCVQTRQDRLSPHKSARLVQESVLEHVQTYIWAQMAHSSSAWINILVTFEWSHTRARIRSFVECHCSWFAFDP